MGRSLELRILVVSLVQGENVISGLGELNAWNTYACSSCVSVNVYHVWSHFTILRTLVFLQSPICWIDLQPQRSHLLVKVRMYIVY